MGSQEDEEKFLREAYKKHKGTKKEKILRNIVKEIQDHSKELHRAIQKRVELNYAFNNIKYDEKIAKSIRLGIYQNIAINIIINDMGKSEVDGFIKYIKDYDWEKED